jgi:hypothetical protein
MRKSLILILGIIVSSLFVSPVMAKNLKGNRIRLLVVHTTTVKVDEPCYVIHGWRADNLAQNKIIKEHTFELYIDNASVRLKRKFNMTSGLRGSLFYVQFDANHFDTREYNFTGIWRDNNGIQTRREEVMVEFIP